MFNIYHTPACRRVFNIENQVDDTKGIMKNEGEARLLEEQVTKELVINHDS
jgi:hypothetical protein